MQNEQSILFPQSGFDAVGIAASTGGLAVLKRVLSAVAAEFPAPIILVQHRSTGAPGVLERILSASTTLKVVPARDGSRLRPGHVFVAPADADVAVDADARLAILPRQPLRNDRSSADALLGSIAARFGPRSLAVVLTGRGLDGAKGARLIRQAGGVVIVQDPRTCEADSMPNAVLARNGADFVLEAEGIGPALETLVSNASLAAAAFGVPRVRPVHAT